MIRPQRYFPWKIARQFFLNQMIFVVVTLVFAGFSLRYFAFTTFLKTSDVHQALSSFDHYLTTFFIAIFLFASIYMAFTTRKYMLPLGRLIQRARELRRVDAKLDEFDELGEDVGEWYDLERALKRLHIELRTKSDDLSREREELSALIGAVSEAILAIDRDGMPLFFNSQFALMFEMAQSQQKESPKSFMISEIFRSPEILSAYREVLENGRAQQVAVSLHTLHQGSIRHFLVSIAPLRSPMDNIVFGALGIFHDVSELKQAEQIRIEFVGNASHELRTPLTTIKGYLDTVREDVRENRFDTASSFLDIINRNVDRLIFLVNDLLDLSSLESGAEIKKTSVSTREITESVLKLLETKRAQRRQEIHAHYGIEQIFGDARRVEQVLVNLIHNAIKYIPEGQRIDINWERTDHASILRVKDSGPGIPLEHQPRLFERFYRVDPGRSRDQGGTGLGLAIVKHIMLKHSGSVRLGPSGGSADGAEFICTFPD